MHKDRFSILQVEFPEASASKIRKVLRGPTAWHSGLVLYDHQEDKSVAQICFSAKNNAGRTLPFTGVRPFNALRVLAASAGLGAYMDRKIDVMGAKLDVSRLKGIMIMLVGEKCKPINPDMPQKTRLSGDWSKVLDKWSQLAFATDEVNRKNIIFTSIGILTDANNCRAGIKTISDLAGIKFSQLHADAVLGIGCKLANSIVLDSNEYKGVEIDRDDERLESLQRMLRQSSMLTPAL